MKAICKYVVFKLFIVLIFLILMLKSPFQGRSIKCMYVCIYLFIIFFIDEKRKLLLKLHLLRLSDKHLQFVITSASKILIAFNLPSFREKGQNFA